MKKIFSIILLGLFFSMGTVWGVDYHYVNTSNWDLTSDFRSALTQDGTSRTIDGNTYTKTRKFGSTASSLGNPNDIGTKYIVYEIKSTATDFDIYVYNKNNSDKYLYISEIEEGATSATTTNNKVNKNTGTKITYSTSGTKNKTIYFFVNSTDILIGDIVAKETGTELPSGGEIGFSMSFNKGRSAIKSGTAIGIENMEFFISSNYSVLSSTVAPIKTLGTHYVKFTLPVAAQVRVTTSNTAKYYVATEKSTAEEAKTNETTPVADVASKFNLTAGTWYINPNGSNVNITKIEFVEIPASYSVTFNLQGHGEAIEAQTIDEGEKVVKPTDPSADGFAFGGWYKEAGCANAWDFENDVVTATTELFAKWSASYTVSYYDEETLLGTEEVIVGDHPTAAGINTNRTPLYSFDGWYANASLTGDALNLAEQTISAETSYYGKWTATSATTPVEMVWDKSKQLCDGSTPSANVKSDDANVAPYLTISFTNVAGGTAGAEGGSLNTGKNLGNTFIIAAKEGYAFDALQFFGKIEDTNCEYSINGGAWITLASTNTSDNACYEVFEDQDVYVFALRNTGTKGVWIRNMQIDVKASASSMKVFQRSVTAEAYATICLPYAVAATAHQNVTVYNIAGKNIGTGDVVTSIVLAEEDGALVAGRPYIFQSTSANVTFIYNVADAAAAGSHNGLVGTLSDISIDAPYYLLANNTIVNAVSGSSLPANRAYIDMASVPEYNPSQAPGARIVEIALNENNATDIQNIEGSEKAVKFFQNGNLYILRDGVVYDAMGKMVR